VAFLRPLTDGYTKGNPAVTAKIDHNIKEIRKKMLQQEAQDSDGKHSRGTTD
jgi:hypothetical protein